MHSKSTLARICALPLLACVAFAAGCSHPDDDSVAPRVEFINKTSQAIMGHEPGWINGTYGAHCTDRSGNWSARVTGSGAMTYDELTVVKNNAQCELTVTSIMGRDGEMYYGAPAIELATEFASAASKFARNEEPVTFLANAKVDAHDFSDGFTISLQYSDYMREGSESSTPTYATVSSTAASSSVPAPDYALSFDGFTVFKDNANIVTSVAGELGLTLGEVSGETFVVSSNQSLGSTFQDVDDEFMALSPTNLSGAISGAALGLEEAQLPTVRTIIIAHTSNGVRSYQVIRIAFGDPT